MGDDRPDDRFEESPTLTRSESDGSTFGRPLPMSQALTSGQRFGGYLIHRLLGKGGMGEVYEAEQVETGRRVALKVMGDLDPTPQARERFLREGRLAASVNHPHSVYVYGTEEIEGTWVISMELLGGGTLKDRVKAHGPMAPKEAVDAILNVIDGLEAAAAAGVLHRDVKPANCFVEVDGTVKIGDFGLSLSTLSRERSAQLTSSGTVIGTPAFASPEQLRGEEVDVRSDIYSVGATLYYLLTGKPPFEGENLMQLLTAIAEKSPQPPRALNKGVPNGLNRVVLDCLSKKVAARPPDYRRLRADLALSATWAAPMEAMYYERVAAIFIDLGLTWAGAFFLAYIAARNHVPFSLIANAVAVALVVAGVPVMLSGQSVGEALMGLRALDVNGFRPSWTRRLTRIIGFVFLLLAALVGFPLVLLALLDRRRGDLKVIERWTGTRLVRSRTDAESRSEKRTVLTVDEPAHTSFGAFLIGRRASCEPAIDVFEGFDPVLRRPVLVDLRPDHPSPSPARREVRRRTRHRWLMRASHAGETADVYESLTGNSLLCTPLPLCWDRVRRLLLDIASELEEAERDGTLPQTLDLDCVWLTPVQRGRLVDLPMTLPKGHGVSLAADLKGVQGFLLSIAIAALEGRTVGAGLPAVPLPRNALRFLEDLSTGAFQSLASVVKVLRVLERGDARISRTRVALAALPMIIVLGVLLPLVLSVEGVVVTFSARSRAELIVSLSIIGVTLIVMAVLRVWRFMSARTGTTHVWGGRELSPRGGGHLAPQALLAREAWFWLPIGLAWISVVSMNGPWAVAILAWAAYAVGIAWTVVRPDRGLLGRLTNTSFVATHSPFGGLSSVDEDLKGRSYERLLQVLGSPLYADWQGRSSGEWANLEKDMKQLR